MDSSCKQGEWYLVGFCETAEELRTFKCERILSAKGLGEAFTVPENFSLETYWSSREKIFRQNRRAEEFYPVILRMTNPEPEFTAIKVMMLPNNIEVLEPGKIRNWLYI